MMNESLMGHLEKTLISSLFAEKCVSFTNLVRGLKLLLSILDYVVCYTIKLLFVEEQHLLLPSRLSLGLIKRELVIFSLE